jgi:Zn-dependent M28 family amino/carboxypeptidase
MILLMSLLLFAGPSTAINGQQLLSDLKVLSADDMEGRKTGTAASVKARSYIVKRFHESGIRPFGNSYEQHFQFNDKQKNLVTGANVVGFVPGELLDQFIVISAHYDHLGVQKGQIYNGADDNASGVAALFQLASHFQNQRTKHSLIITAFDAEEGPGASGARYFLAHAPVNAKSIVLNVNLDMIGRDHNNILYACGTYHFPFLRNYLQRVALRSPVKLVFGHDQPTDKDDWTKESDHYAFGRAGIPWIYFGVEDYEHHHQPTDDFENMTFDFYMHAVETIISAIHELDQFNGNGTSQ